MYIESFALIVYSNDSAFSSALELDVTRDDMESDARSTFNIRSAGRRSASEKREGDRSRAKSEGLRRRETEGGS
jgi:hypothetical protein